MFTYMKLWPYDTIRERENRQRDISESPTCSEPSNATDALKQGEGLCSEHFFLTFLFSSVQEIRSTAVSTAYGL